MEENKSPIIGIDLGTTNSVVAAIIDGKVQVIEENGEAIVPSVVGMTADGKLIVGQVGQQVGITKAWRIEILFENGA